MLAFNYIGLSNNHNRTETHTYIHLRTLACLYPLISLGGSDNLLQAQSAARENSSKIDILNWSVRSLLLAISKCAKKYNSACE